MKKLSREDLHNLLYGCTILGTGGGGALDKGINRVEEALSLGKEFKFVSLNEVPDDAIIACPYYCGAISPISPEEEKKYAALPRVKEEPVLRAFRALEEYMRQDFYGTISTELGGANTAMALYAAAMMGKCFVDADPAGRSVPELQHTTFFINGVPITPMAVANEFGDLAIFTQVVDDFRAEALVRALAIVSKNSVAVADHPLKGSELRKAVIHGALSYALEIGEAYRNAIRENKNKGEAIASAGKGEVLFQGIVERVTWETKEGFTIGDTYLINDHGNERYHIWFKNENIVAWRNDQVEVTVPDLICVIAEESEKPVTNPYLQPGMKVSVVALPAPEEWLSPKGLEVFGPRSFDFDFDYVPFKERGRK
jgi:hypothetical protein